MTSRKYDEIDDSVAGMIAELHKKHPKLGHRGIDRALQQSGVHVDPSHLEEFMRTRKIEPQRDWRPWKWSGAPSWLGGSGKE
jgi:hypothetical protein